MNVPKIGDTVWEMPAVGPRDVDSYFRKKEQGTVIYVHPQNRYYVVQFKGFRESYIIT